MCMYSIYQGRKQSHSERQTHTVKSVYSECIQSCNCTCTCISAQCTEHVRMYMYASPKGNTNRKRENEYINCPCVLFASIEEPQSDTPFAQTLYLIRDTDG